MKWIAPWLLAALPLVAQAPPPPAAPQAPPPAAVPVPEDQVSTKTVSASGLFVIHGSDFRVRGAFASLAEAVQADLNEAVGPGARYRKEGEEWKNSIVIELFGQEHDEAPARLINTSEHEVINGFRLQLNVHLAKGLPPGLDRAVLERILAERGVRKPPEEQVQIEVSPWLLDGLAEAIRWRKGERDRALYAALFANNQLFPVEKLLEVEDPEQLDAVARGAFRASAGALVMALLGQNGGKPAMNALLEEDATFVGEDMALLLKHFPGLNLGKTSLAKWWALQLARMSETPMTQTMTIKETDDELERLLVVRFRGPNGDMMAIPAANFRDLLALPIEPRQDAIRPVVETVGLMAYRAFPAYHPVMRDYMRILSDLAVDKDEGAEAQLEVLAQRRAEMLSLGDRTRDYLDWYRITNANELSGAFRDYIELKENLDTTRTRSESQSSNYLDDLQEVYDSAAK